MGRVQDSGFVRLRLKVSKMEMGQVRGASPGAGFDLASSELHDGLRKGTPSGRTRTVSILSFQSLFLSKVRSMGPQ